MANTTRFSPPPLDGTLTVDEIYDWHRVNSSGAAAFRFSDENQASKNQMTDLTWKDLGDGIDRGIEIIETLIPMTHSLASLDSQDPVVVGILATSDVITYTTFLFSHLRLAHPTVSRHALLPFPISTRNSPAAVSHLVKVKGIKFLWITEGSMKAMVDSALKEGGLGDVTVLHMPSFTQLYNPLDSPRRRYRSDLGRLSIEAPALILHSSGSTAFPKPRTFTHRTLLEWSQMFKQGGLDGTGEIMAVHGLPVFHALGVSLAVCAAATGYIRAAPSPHVHVPSVTPEYFLEEITKSKSTLLATVPSFLEAWSNESENVEKLKKLKAIFWGGAPLNSDIGRFLHKEGVKIHVFYGATEFGIASFTPDQPLPEGYEWFRFAKHVSPLLIPEEDDGIFELAFKETASHHLTALNTEIDGVPAYASSDLLERHPNDPNLYRIRGRKDDQIMLSTGEKTNPGPLETIIVKDTHVKNAIMFGRGRTQNGVLIEPESYEEAKKLGLEKFRNLIWPSIEEANNFAPAHSRVFKEMIIIASLDKPFSYTLKLNARRGAILIDYEPEIESAYRAAEDSAQLDIPLPVGTSETGSWTLEEALQFVGEVVNKVITGGDVIAIDEDLFGRGCDSLQATYIRNALLHAVRQVTSPSVVHNIPPNFVYQQPTISKLARYIVTSAFPGENSTLQNSDIEQTRFEGLRSMVKKYTRNWPVHRPLQGFNNIDSETILLTGSTGGLGSQLLAQLAAMPNVSQIYAFNRPGRDGRSSWERHAKAFEDRGNDPKLLDSGKVIFVEGDTSAEGLGIDDHLYNKIRESVTTIIHNAWRVDFNLSLLSFEPAIRGVRLLVDLALRSPHPTPPRVMFTSSVGTVRTWLDIPPIQEAPVDELSLISNSGYGESKWVSEQILAAAGRETAMHPVIVRVHQLSGGINGSWNSREWFPAIVRAAQVIGAVPNNHGVVSFLPLHVAASALIESRHTPHQYVHLAHPRPISWKTIIQHVAKSLEVPIIPYNQWLERLEASPTTDEALHNNPALHLVEFYRASAPPKNAENIDERETMGLATFDIKGTVAGAPSLSAERLPRLDQDDVESWIEYWHRKGALEKKNL